MSYTAYLINKETRKVLPSVTKNYTHGTMISFDPLTNKILPNPMCELNITYNYGNMYEEAFGKEGIDILDGKTAEEAAPLLASAIIKLSGQPDEDYWKSTPGNASAALRILLTFALDQPDGMFSID